MPLLNIYGKYDHLVPPEACEQLVKHVGSTDTEDICLKTGHIGIYVSSKFQAAFAPKIANWLKERDTIPPKKRAPRKKTQLPIRPTASKKASKQKKTLQKVSARGRTQKSRVNAAIGNGQ
jgi:polyhydroxyalkanoate synthase